MLLFPFEQAGDCLKRYRDYCLRMPDEMGTAAGLLTGADGTKVCAVVVCCYGPTEATDRALRSLRALGKPVADFVAPIAYTTMQTLLDEAMAHGVRSYWKTHLLTRIEDELIDTAVSAFAAVPSARTAVVIQQIGSAVQRVPRDATAFNHRDAAFDFEILSLWTDPGDDERNIRWTQDLGERTAVFSSVGVYVNNLGDEAPDQVRRAYGSNYERLAALKRRYDPENLFRLNQNIRPMPAGRSAG
jgi:FAD/FMN-containing dehydrogenase